MHRRNLPIRQTAQPERRVGPRPLPLHLLTQASTLLGSQAALPHLKNGSLPWKPHLAQSAADLAADLDGLAPEAVAAAIGAEACRRFDDFLTGIELYRHHPYRRDLSDPPQAWSDGSTRLLDYGDAQTGGPPVLVVPSLINRAYILDLTDKRSLMRHMAAKGLHPYLLDWGAPEPAEAAFTLTDYVAGRLEAAIEAVAAAHGGKIAVAGYCMGGLLALAAALRRPDKVSALALLATPWDFHADRQVQARLIKALEVPLAEMIARYGVLPIDVLQMLFNSIDPGLVGRKFRALATWPKRSARVRDFVALEDWLNDGVPLVAEVARECLFGWYGRNDPMLGRWRIAGTCIRPEELTVPALVLQPERDRIVPPASAAALADRLPGAVRRTTPTGHIGMVTGSRAKTEVYGPLTRWLARAALQHGACAPHRHSVKNQSRNKSQ